MRKRPSCCSRNSEHGSTILEVMIALAILSALALGAWSAVGASLRLSGRQRERVRESADLLAADDALRGLALRVRPPFWGPPAPTQVGPDELVVPFLDGDPRKSLHVAFRDGTLLLGDGAATAAFTGFTSGAVAPAVDAAGTVYGLSIELTRADGRTVTIVARFGGMPVGGPRE
jgi:hypothetical protein